MKSPAPRPADAPLPTAAELAVSDGKLIDAIRIVRETSGVDLATAKSRIDAYLAARPALREKFDDENRRRRAKLIRWVILIDALLVAAFLLWWFSR